MARPETPRSEGTPDEFEAEVEEDVTKPKEPQKKIAILGSEGTSQKISLLPKQTFSDLASKQPHPPTVKRRRKGPGMCLLFPLYIS